MALGIRVNSRWIDSDHGYDDVPFIQEANRDYWDIDRADFVIIDTGDTDTKGGRDWESGYATGRGKRVVRVGPIITPFHARVNLGFESWGACLAHFATAIEHADARDN
jgi:nucleoside 2-deoxyribosyltransferase